MRAIRNISLSIFDNEGYGIPGSAAVSYAIYDTVDASYRSRGSFNIAAPDFTKQIDVFLEEVRLEICTREGVPCPSSSSGSA